jgi:hypothetical protein
MIAQAGLLSFRMGYTTSLEKSTCTQRSVLITRLVLHLHLKYLNLGSAQIRYM